MVAPQRKENRLKKCKFLSSPTGERPPYSLKFPSLAQPQHNGQLSGITM